MSKKKRLFNKFRIEHNHWERNIILIKIKIKMITGENLFDLKYEVHTYLETRTSLYINIKDMFILRKEVV